MDVVVWVVDVEGAGGWELVKCPKDLLPAQLTFFIRQTSYGKLSRRRVRVVADSFLFKEPAQILLVYNLFVSTIGRGYSQIPQQGGFQSK